MRKLVLATHNPGKLREIKALFEGMPYEIVTYKDYDNIPDVVEDGETFEENAAKKARHFARLTGELSLADDSGLEVEALGGEPGVYSARYAGEKANDEANNAKLLKALASISQDRRTACFRCVMVLCEPDGTMRKAEGSCSGVIIDAPRGSNGFGYDPLFYLPQYNLTMAEITPELKNQLSHRSRALRQIKEILKG